MLNMQAPSIYYKRIDFSRTREEWLNRGLGTPCQTYTGYCDKRGGGQLKARTPGFKGSRKIPIQKIIVATRDFLPIFGLHYWVERLCGNHRCIESAHLVPRLSKAAWRMVSEYRKAVLANAAMDKYYTKPAVARECYIAMKSLMIDHEINMDEVVFVEPSAGAGVFLDVIEEPSIGFDLAPGRDDIHELDFLLGDFRPIVAENVEGFPKRCFIIGNPPFGTKATLAIDFVNNSFKKGASLVGFIVPLQFRKWSVHSKIVPGAKLLMDNDLPEFSFEFMGKDYGVRCCFQVWSRKGWRTKLPDLRMTHKPETTHKDFEMWQYNNTEQAKKYFDKSVYNWDFGVPRQGFADYNNKIFSAEECNPKQQWIFFRAKNGEVLRRLMGIDFVKLSLLNTGTPGFGKADVVQEYITQYGR